MYLADFEYLHPFWKYLPSNFEFVRNPAKFCMFLAPKFFLRKVSRYFWSLFQNWAYYRSRRKISHRSADVARRSRNRKKVKKRQQNISLLRKLSFSGELTKQYKYVIHFCKHCKYNEKSTTIPDIKTFFNGCFGPFCIALCLKKTSRIFLTVTWTRVIKF